MSKLARNIRTYRKKHNLTQTDFASKLFVTKQAVSKWETGRGYPDSALIPKIAEVMDISIDTLMGEKRKNKKLIPLLAITTIILILVIFIAPIISNNIKEANEFSEFTSVIEGQVKMDLPDDGELVTANFDDWQGYGNVINVDRMSYFTYDQTRQMDEFELELSTSNKWTTTLDAMVINSIPTSIQSYVSIGDYYSVYNVSSDTYNEVPTLPGENDFIFLIYQMDNQRLIVLDYSITIEEGD